MKGKVGVVVLLILIAVAGYIIWDRFAHPLEAHIAQPTLQRGVFTGQLVNDGQGTIDHVVLNVTFHNAAGASTGKGSAEFSHVEAGKQLPFRIPAPAGATGETYTLEARSGGL